MVRNDALKYTSISKQMAEAPSVDQGVHRWGLEGVRTLKRSGAPWEAVELVVAGAPSVMTLDEEPLC
jgi:hypothetical protein